ncbi:MAG: carbohydrate ABC transporter permease [Eubacteriales bacterium]|nr:carbohydrate ABC transporter permease [Eubacteriales bacterium]
MTKCKKVLLPLIMLLTSLLFIFPIFWMFVSATNDTAGIVMGKLTFGTALPTNFENLMKAKNIWTAMFNSLRNAALQTVLSLFISSLAGYGFEVFHDRHKDALMNVLLLSMLIPQITTAIPLFKMFSSWGLLNTWIAFVLPGIASVFLIMLFRQSARSFPGEVIQAARVDGLGEFGIFIRMFVPIMAPTYVAALTITFMNAWNSYLWPSIVMLSNESTTMPLLLANLMSGYTQDYGMILLAVAICTLPTLLIFAFLQKSFASGITGAVKM